MKPFKQFISEATGTELSDILQSKGYKVKSATKTSLTIMVSGNRLKEMENIAAELSKQGAKIDSNLKGSSIGGIVVGNVKILIKADGKSGGLDVEAKAIGDLEDAIAVAVIENGGPISVKVGGKVVKGVAWVNKTAGTPKSDFHLCDVNEKPLVHISHKKGSKPNDFQQWGGLTEKEIIKHPEVQKFIGACQALYGNKIPNGESVFKVIKSKDLAMMAVFGVNFAASGIDVNKVDVLIQGDPGLKRVKEGVYELTGTGHVHYHGDLPDGGFTPVLACIYKGDRDQFDIKGARFSIYPRDGRKFKQEMK
jgi:hypothetical protein